MQRRCIVHIIELNSINTHEECFAARVRITLIWEV
jgi:hypothetical protein